MTAALTKPCNTMARLHLGCGESLSQLLPDEVTVPAQPVLVERRRRPRQPVVAPKRGEGN